MDFFNTEWRHYRCAEHLLAGEFQAVEVQRDLYGIFRGVHLRMGNGLVLDTCHKEIRSADGSNTRLSYEDDELGIHKFCEERLATKGYLDLDELEPQDSEYLG